MSELDAKTKAELWEAYQELQLAMRGVATNVQAPATVTFVGKPTMIMRSLRVPEALWIAAKAKADERNENISDVIREALERYVRSKR